MHIVHQLFEKKKEKLYMFSNSKVLENGFIYRILIDVQYCAKVMQTEFGEFRYLF